MMTPAHVAKLRNDVRSFLESAKSTPVPFSAIVKHTMEVGWNMADEEMFKGWLRSNAPTLTNVNINYGA